jgi:hypothetical protein
VLACLVQQGSGVVHCDTLLRFAQQQQRMVGTASGVRKGWVMAAISS